MNPLIPSLWCLGRGQRLSWRNGLLCERSVVITRSLASSPRPTPAISEDGKSLRFSDSSSPGRYHAVWLRHHCQCPQCLASTGQRTIPLSILSSNVRLRSAVLEGEKLHMDWSTDGDGHSGYINVDWLKENDYSEESLSNYNTSIEPSVGNGIPVIEHDEVVESLEGLWRWLYHLNSNGVCLVKNVPKDPDYSYRKMVERICSLQKTIYGEIFHVRSESNPINIAYTTEALDYHMDLVYYQSPPGIQLLHCIRNDSCVDGGLSLLLDVLPVVKEMREKHYDEFLTLTRVPATFQKIHFERESPVVMIRHQPHIVLDRNGKVIRVNWSPPFEGPLKANEDEIEAYYQAYCTFKKVMDASPYKLEHNFSPGDVISFNNQRILHGRTAIKLNGGMRHLVGCYLNIDAFCSRFRVISEQLGKKTLTKHVLNGSSYL